MLCFMSQLQNKGKPFSCKIRIIFLCTSANMHACMCGIDFEEFSVFFRISAFRTLPLYTASLPTVDCDQYYLKAREGSWGSAFELVFFFKHLNYEVLCKT